MATFEVTGPDGATYEITAPDENAAMQAFQQMIGGGGQPAAPQAQPVPAPAPPAVPQADIDAAGDSALLRGVGIYDEVRGFGGGVASLIGGGSFGEGYTEGRDRARAGVEAYREQAGLGGQLAEAGAMMLTGPGAGAATVLGRLGQAAVAGGLGGGAVGFASGEGGAGERLQNAGVQGAIGAGLGAGAGALVEGAARGVGAIGNAVGLGNAGANARRAVGERLELDGLDPATISTPPDKPMTLADMGEETLSLAGRAFRQGGAKNEFRQVLEGRSRGQFGRMVDDVDRAFQTRGADFGKRRAELMKARSDEAATLLSDAYAQAPPGMGARLERTIERSPTMQRVYEKAQNRAKDRGVDFSVTRGRSQQVDEVGQREVEAAAKDQAEARELVARVQELQHETGLYRKRPVHEYLKKLGGIDPRGPLAGELRHSGITPRTSPGLFKRGGMKSADNLPEDEAADVLGFGLDGDGAGYLSQDGVIEALTLEARGAPKRAVEDEEALRELGQLLPHFDDALELAQEATIQTRLPVVQEDRATVEGLHLMRMELDDLIGAAEANSPSRVPELIGLRDVVDERLKATPEMQRFDLSYASDSEGLAAFERGVKFLREDAFETAQDVANLPAAQYENFRLGVAKALLDRMGAKSDTANAGALFNNPATRGKVSAVFKDQAEFEEFMRRAEAEGAMQRTFDSVMRGSQTAERVAEDGRSLPMNVLTDAANFKFGSAAGRVIGAGVERAQGRAGEKVNREMARLLLAQDAGSAAREVVAQRGRDEASRRALSSALSALGLSAGGSAATRAEQRRRSRRGR